MIFSAPSDTTDRRLGRGEENLRLKLVHLNGKKYRSEGEQTGSVNPFLFLLKNQQPSDIFRFNGESPC